jgi:hypothetical protein
LVYKYPLKAQKRFSVVFASATGQRKDFFKEYWHDDKSVWLPFELGVISRCNPLVRSAVVILDPLHMTVETVEIEP